VALYFFDKKKYFPSEKMDFLFLENSKNGKWKVESGKMKFPRVPPYILTYSNAKQTQ